MLRRFFAYFLPLLSALATLAPAAAQQQSVRVRIVKADALRHDDKIGKNTQSLNGHVVLAHQNTFLNCDSAYMYNDSNVVVAYGSIHVIQNDSIHLYGDRMTYYGDRNIVKVRDNVRANKGQTWLYTEFLDYDRLADQAYFYNGGKVVNGDNVLSSERGVYYPMSNDVYFKDNVVGSSPKYSLLSDTTSFNTKSEVVSILGPTTITTSDSTIISSELGWYDTRSEVAKILRSNKIFSVKNNSTLVGNTILYERTKGLGTAWDDVAICDSADNVVLFGDYGFYNQFTKEALATRKALVQHVVQGDTIFLHADTLRIVPLADSSRLLKAYHRVKLFKPDLQCRCDSFVFDCRDSVGYLYNQPVVWSQGNQMTAHVIKIYTRNQAVYKSELIDAAFVISAEPDSVGFDQVKGKLITGYVRNNEIYLIHVDGNGQTIYYPKDGPDLIGINRAESSSLSIWLENRRVSHITMRVSPSGNMNPPLLLGEKDRKLAGFRWLDEYRPKSRDDVFLDMPLKPDDVQTDDVFEGYSFDEL